MQGVETGYHGSLANIYYLDTLLEDGCAKACTSNSIPLTALTRADAPISSG